MKIKLLRAVLSLVLVLCLVAGTVIELSRSSEHHPLCDFQDGYEIQ